MSCHFCSEIAIGNAGIHVLRHLQSRIALFVIKEYHALREKSIGKLKIFLAMRDFYDIMKPQEVKQWNFGKS